MLASAVAAQAAKRQRWRWSRSQLLAAVNELRCGGRPVYGRDLVEGLRVAHPVAKVGGKCRFGGQGGLQRGGGRDLVEGLCIVQPVAKVGGGGGCCAP